MKKRIQANPNCSFDNFEVYKNGKYQYGCEFEFYIDTDNRSFEASIELITSEIYEFTNVDILVDTINLPIDKDKNSCIQIKPDISLQENGIEISVPITSADGIKYFIEKLCPIIDKYGYSNEETGFHIHISTTEKNGINFNFYKYMLLCHQANLLSSWKPRIGYSQNVMDILSSNSKQVSRKIKTKKGTIWNLEKIESNHIEIKSVGGVDYHQFSDKIINEFSLYDQLFASTLQADTEKDKLLYQLHKEELSKLSTQTEATFSSALSEAGII